eukprot:COSAG06_NODE_59972_length_272_cov_0.895954_1_plen_26_part_10
MEPSGGRRSLGNSIESAALRYGFDFI